MRVRMKILVTIGGVETAGKRRVNANGLSESYGRHSLPVELSHDVLI